MPSSCSRRVVRLENTDLALKHDDEIVICDKRRDCINIFLQSVSKYDE